MTVLEIKNLLKRFKTPDGKQHVVVDVPAFSIEAGEQVVLVGGSGSGKTTLLNLIAGILAAEEGKIILAGKEITTMPESTRDRWRAAHVGYVFQTFNLLQGYTALENVEMGMRFGQGVDHKRAKLLLESVGMHDRLHFKPRQLSVGQQQRVAVARALANQPSLVLADEPTGNLDPQLAAQSLARIREGCQANNAALLLVTHDKNIMAAFDKVIDLKTINRAMDQMVDTKGGEA